MRCFRRFEQQIKHAPHLYIVSNISIFFDHLTRPVFTKLSDWDILIDLHYAWFHLYCKLRSQEFQECDLFLRAAKLSIFRWVSSLTVVDFLGRSGIFSVNFPVMWLICFLLKHIHYYNVAGITHSTIYIFCIEYIGTQLVVFI